MILVNGEKVIDLGWISAVIPVSTPRIISSKGPVRKAHISFVCCVLLSSVNPRTNSCLPILSPIIAEAIGNVYNKMPVNVTEQIHYRHIMDKHHIICKHLADQLTITDT